MKTYFSLDRIVRPTRSSPAARAIAALALAGVTVCGPTLAFAEQGASADELLNDANQVLQQLDTSHYAALWQDAAPFVKASVPQERFTSQMQQARQSVGAVTRRGWASVTRIQYSGTKGIPDGLYANVDFATTLASGRTMFELLSFRLGDDGQWHLTGYVPRQTQDRAAAQSQIATP
ncbi:MAG: DUF4019 domain-containing protein [Pseudomonadota bacterium]|jgi:hypothetical protein|uniref:DUF4019 domain-containing protein n=1 Tax=Burkholderiaceae TaxID=119060 RepID=UPI0010F57602|nr:DUF4019 domain-containing protein [Burkholderia sp. 4M9327F10]